MLYKFYYNYKNEYLTHICTTDREADMFFRCLIALHVDYLKVITFTRNKY